jgi:hypothetical protein
MPRFLTGELWVEITNVRWVHLEEVDKDGEGEEKEVEDDDDGRRRALGRRTEGGVKQAEESLRVRK